LQNEQEAEDRTENQNFSITDSWILKALEMIPFVSIRQIAKMTFTLLQLYFAAWRNRFTSSWSNYVGFPQILRSLWQRS
jgi:hypothetical protein